MEKKKTSLDQLACSAKVKLCIEFTEAFWQGKQIDCYKNSKFHLDSLPETASF